MKRLILLLIISSSLQLMGQNYPQQYFRQPIDGKLRLSGNFGELRSDHLHSGLDFKTAGKIGALVYASADGYIARIKISVNGFGKAVYVRHPNGFTTVYGHLNHFNNQIEDYVREAQYKKESFEIELFPLKEELKVKKGKVIAFSGNTGGSGGPHLHFEIRDSKSEKPINPLLFGFEVKDHIRPKIKGLKLYPADDRALIAGKNEEKVFQIAGSGMHYRIKLDPIINVSGKLSFGINTYDLANDSYNKIGVYKVQLYVDSNLVYEHDVETFAFSESKFVNSFIDYSHYIKKKERFQRSERDPGNKLSIYNIQDGNGIFEFSDSLVHHLRYVVKDVNNNISSLEFRLKASQIKILNQKRIEKHLHWFDYSQKNAFENEDVLLEFRKGSFYKSFDFKYKQLDYKKNTFSRLHQIHYPETPVHKAFKLAIKIRNVPEHLLDKIFIGRLDEGHKIEVLDSKYVNGFITASAKKFGRYLVSADTINPQIKALNVHHKKNIEGYKRIVFEIKDELSGVSKYRATLNGKWILCEYDKKSDRLVYNIDDRIQKGLNKLKLIVSDALNNESTYQVEFNY